MSTWKLPVGYNFDPIVTSVIGLLTQSLNNEARRNAASKHLQLSIKWAHSRSSPPRSSWSINCEPNMYQSQVSHKVDPCPWRRPSTRISLPGHDEMHNGDASRVCTPYQAANFQMPDGVSVAFEPKFVG